MKTDGVSQPFVKSYIHDEHVYLGYFDIASWPKKGSPANHNLAQKNI
jgi:hypothetical protein